MILFALRFQGSWEGKQLGLQTMIFDKELKKYGLGFVHFYSNLLNYTKRYRSFYLGSAFGLEMDFLSVCYLKSYLFEEVIPLNRNYVHFDE